MATHDRYYTADGDMTTTSSSFLASFSQPTMQADLSHYHHAHHQNGNGHGLETSPVKPKRQQVKNACVNCQRACKKCDEGRPCQRCVKYNLTATCVDSPRKERQKGIKRGPYKRRKKAGEDKANPYMSINTNGSNSPLTTLPPFASAASNAATDPAFYTTYDAYTYPVNPAALLHQQHLQQLQAPSASSANNNSISAPIPTLATVPHSAPTPPPGSGSSNGGGTEQSEDGSKLTILSQLCSAVLHSDSREGEVESKSDN
ncbi:uncharacterized protein VTP21DRAFT_7493 [Calcarisporiella thermophila]|uniref:uncharacterized protein n=1 Tax=Calcarisporiella thermophila TaxID=911321 RepID=UPI00374399E3